MEAFTVVGISVRTSNENMQMGKDIGDLWMRFHAEKLAQKIPNKVDANFYSVYSDYEGDHTKPYTVTVGCRVSSDEKLPEGLVKVKVASGDYSSHIAKGNIFEGSVYQAWQKIWEHETDRAYSSDYEVYTPEAQQNPQDCEVAIYIATGAHE